MGLLPGLIHAEETVQPAVEIVLDRFIEVEFVFPRLGGTAMYCKIGCAQDQATARQQPVVNLLEKRAWVRHMLDRFEAHDCIEDLAFGKGFNASEMKLNICPLMVRSNFGQCLGRYIERRHLLAGFGKQVAAETGAACRIQHASGYAFAREQVALHMAVAHAAPFGAANGDAFDCHRS